MSDIAIRVENLSKLYCIGQRERYKALRDTLTDAMYAPFRRIRSTFQRSNVQRSNDNYIWALKDVSFEVKRGEVVGIIGRNGAGKTTLLKILSRITEPTEGYAEVRGRVGSLLEVGTGFHPELTGRENIYLNGAILGMKKAEIDRKFDEIVAFAEIEKFIDTPVKHYSSGMYVRLAFAVAAHLEPEILLVDEVLAIGDISFQKKCLGKMSEVSRTGRTVLFVSHNMQAVASLCSRAVHLESGRIVRDGRPQDIISKYLESQSDVSAGTVKWTPDTAPGDEVLRLLFVRVLNGRHEIASDLLTSEDVTIEYGVDIANLQDGLRIGFDLVTPEGTVAFRSFHNDSDDGFQGQLRVGFNVLRCTIPGNLLNEGKYDICARIGIHMVRWIVHLDRVATFCTVRADEARGGYSGSQPGAVAPLLRWSCMASDPVSGYMI